MQIELQTLQRNVGITFVLVTHDQEEALSMSDRVCIMREGRIVQIGTPQDLYDRPIDRYVADFVGRSNFFDGVVVGVTDAALDIRLNSGSVIKAVSPDRQPAFVAGDRVSVSIRPEQMFLSRDRARVKGSGALSTSAEVLNRISLGEHTEYLLRSDKLGEFLVLSPRQSESSEPPLDQGEIVHVGCSTDAALVLESS